LLFVTASAPAPFAAPAAGSEVPAIAAAAPLRSDMVTPPAAPVAATITHTGFAAAPAPAPAAPRAARTGTIPYTVVRGDTLWKIAETRLGDPLRYPEIAALNRDVLGD